MHRRPGSQGFSLPRTLIRCCCDWFMVPVPPHQSRLAKTPVNAGQTGQYYLPLVTTVRENNNLSFVILGHRAEDPVGYQILREFNKLSNTGWILGSVPEDDVVEGLNESLNQWKLKVCERIQCDTCH